MATKNTRPAAATKIATLELVRKIAPTDNQAEAIHTSFGLDTVDRTEVREHTKEAFISMSGDLAINERALALHFQRLVGSMVASALGAAEFYQNKVSDARNLHTRLSADDVDQRPGVAGFESKAERARQFAAETGLQAYSLMAAAEGAVEAYLHITGDAWKPYVRDQDNSQKVDAKAAQAQMAVFG